MNAKISKALREAEKRLEELLPEIEKRHQQGVENSTEEPDSLKTGATDELEIPRAVKEQKNEELPEK